jgi:hypothetical protein
VTAVDRASQHSSECQSVRAPLNLRLPDRERSPPKPVFQASYFDSFGVARAILAASGPIPIAKLPLVTYASFPARAEQVRATPNVRKDERRQAIAVIEVDSENALTPDFTLIERNDRRRVE